MGCLSRLSLLVLGTQWLVLTSASELSAADKCDEINIQTAAENRWKAKELSKRGVGIFFAGASVNALPSSEKQAIEIELERFFDAFQAVYAPSAYFWGADADLVRQKQARFDYLVVVDAELNVGSLPKYDEYLNTYKGQRIAEEMIAIADYPMRRGPLRTPPYVFIQIVDTGPREAYTMFAEFVLLVLGADLSIYAGQGYYAQLSEYAAGDVIDPDALYSLRRTHDMVVYDCLAPVFKQ